MKRLLMLAVVLVLLCSPALSHSGGTDSKGGHTDHSTGEYHYHHGYSAHDHVNGVCPYESKPSSTDVPVSIAASATYYLTTANVNMRSSASSSSSLLQSIPEGTIVRYKGEKSGNWIKVYYAGLTGWCHSNYLKFHKTATSATVAPATKPVTSSVSTCSATSKKSDSTLDDTLWLICVSFAFGFGVGMLILLAYASKVSDREARAAKAAKFRESQAIELGRQMAYAEIQRREQALSNNRRN